MGWLNKILKGSNRKVSEGRQNSRHGSGVAIERPSHSLDSWSEIEDIDRAIALSLSEEDLRRRTTNNRAPQVEQDELLARALQESMNAESSYNRGHENAYWQRYGNNYDSLYQPITFPYSTSFRICAACNKDIGHGRFLSCMNAVWHPECFRCHRCDQPISDYEFSVSGSYPYHKACYTNSCRPKCDVCKNLIRMNAAGLIEYRAHPFWSQKYCPNHENDGTPRCCSCERMESWDSRCAALNDGRKLCLECLDSAIMDTNECQPLFREIKEFFEGLNMKVAQEVPILLVERQALNEAMGGERHVKNRNSVNGHHHMPETRGLCLSEEQTVSTVLRRPKFGAGNRASGMKTEPYKLRRHCEVTAILILYGLPRLLTGSILAHEMMHAWLRLNGYRGLRQDVEEGICQVIADMWLESQIQSIPDGNGASTSRSGGRSPFERKLSQFFKNQIATDTSMVYGNGFRAGNQAVMGFGLRRTLDHIRETGDFPH